MGKANSYRSTAEYSLGPLEKSREGPVPLDITLHYRYLADALIPRTLKNQNRTRDKLKDPRGKVQSPSLPSLRSGHSLCFCPPSPSALEDDEEDEGHTVVATARGIFNSNGGVLSSMETGVSIIIPQGAIAEGVEQEIYFKVCRDNSILPPLDKEKGQRPALLRGGGGLGRGVQGVIVIYTQ